MKVIVTSWLYPFETEHGYDNRVKSIERISTTVDDVKSYIEFSKRSFGHNIEWSDNLYDLIHGNDDDNDIVKFYNSDGFLCLESLLKNDALGSCVCRLYSRYDENKENAQYFIFQVRNLH